jgi:hypothetical protein
MTFWRGLWLAATLVALSAAAVPAAAGDIKEPEGVVELFTSQGCNSCPPADAVLEELTRSGRLVTLGYHVDYWDYLGWKDTLASADNTERQKAYARSFGIRSVYTPQAVLNGRAHVNGAKRKSVVEALEAMRGKGEGMTVRLKVTRVNDSVMIDAEGSPSGDGNAHLVLVYFDAMRAVEIDRGENKGRSVNYVNPVTDIQTAGMWHGKAVRFELPSSEIEKKKGGCAVLLQVVSKDGRPGPILGAAIISKP